MLTARSVSPANSHGDLLDHVLGAAWIAAEIGLDVFGMLFWSAIGLVLFSLVA